MYSLLIVEDEKWVRQGLCSTIQWEAEGIRLMGEAEDGETALRIIEQEIPDIIITDIKMPGIDGLNLLELIRKRNIRSKVIIISGYSDFQFAQKALKNGAYDYLLKPLKETTLLETVRKCVHDLEAETIHARQLKHLSGSVREYFPLARQQFLEQLLRGEMLTVHQIEAKWDALNITLNPDHIRVIAIQINAWGPRGHEVNDRILIKYALENMAEELGMQMGNAIVCYVKNIEDADFVVVFSCNHGRPTSEGELKSKLQTLIDSANRYLGLVVSIGISQTRNRNELNTSFKESLHAVSYSFYDGHNKVYHASEVPEMNKSLPYYMGPKDWDSRLVQAIKLNDEPWTQKLTDEIREHLEASKEKFSPSSLFNGLKILFSQVEQKLMNADNTDHPDNPSPFIQLSNTTLFQLHQTLREIVENYSKATRNQSHRKKIISMALQYIHENYANGISLNEAAEHLCLNPSYFSKLFHEEMGETFSRYLLRLRVDKAKELLTNSLMKVYEVSSQVGYHDFRHFTKVFKETEGMTPAQYRDYSNDQ